MDDSWQASVVLVTSSNPEEKNFGTGFVIHKDKQATYFLTCEHVVRDVGGPEQVLIDGQPATVVASSPEEGADLALLCVETLIDRPPLQLCAVSKEGDQFSTAGFQLDGKRLVIRELWGKLGKPSRIQTREKAERIKAWDLELTDKYLLQPGYSGSPVVNKYGSVVGVVNTRRDEGKTGVAVLIEALIELWPDMAPSLFEQSTVGRIEQTAAPPLTATPGTTIFTYTQHTDWVGTVMWSPNGEHIASAGGDGIVRIWDASSGHTSRERSQACKWVWKALWSPDGQYIASSGSAPTVCVWDARSGEAIFLYRGHMTLRPMTHIFALAWSPDGTRIASASNAKHPDQAVHIWDARTGNTILKYTGHANKVNPFIVSDLAWSPDGQYIASSGSDNYGAKWNFDPTTPHKSVHVWSPTGARILTCGGDTVCNGVAWSPDSKCIAAGYNKVVTIWDVATGKDIYTYSGHTGDVRAIAWSPDGSIIASASNDHTVHLWHPLTGKILLVYRKHRDKVNTLAWSPDGKRIASAGADKTVQIWQAVEA